tara:strand:- start:350 stop:769 length:420 start_codon:yes stop_codon:yes gene_type:complete
MTLEDYIDSRLSMPFEWGKNDCIIFCSEAIKVVTGIDHLRLEKIKRWNSPLQAKKTLKKLKINTMFDLWDARFRQIKNPNKLRDGDVGVANIGCSDGFSPDTSMIFYKDIFLAPSEKGIIRVPIEQTEYFFDIRNVRLR